MNKTDKKGIITLSPLMVFIGLYLGLGIVAGDFYKVPMSVVFMMASIYAVAISGGFPLSKRISTFSKGAGSNYLMMMLWIYVLAGVFAASAKAMGAIDDTVNLALSLLPANWILPGLFLSSCFISISIGTSVGTVVALVPIAAGVAGEAGISIALATAVIVGGAYFGDNLSFISDTTVVATQTQQCKMNDKFKVNLLIVAPAAVIALVIYAVKGYDMTYTEQVRPVNFLKVLPYLAVIGTAIAGMNVMAVLAIGVLLTGIVGVYTGGYDFFGWLSAMGQGINGMGELIIVAMLAGGMLEIIRTNGGIDYIIDKLTAHVKGKRGAELCIASLVSMVNICTANNTVAILTVGHISKQIGDKYGVDNRKSAGLLDTFSCCVQGMLPYGVQTLLAAGLAHISPMQIVPLLYYPMLIGVAALLSILLRYPRRYS